MINDMGILVQESAPESDDLMAEGDSTDELAAEEAAAVLVAVENELDEQPTLSECTCEMGTVDLLTREGEIEIAKREEGIRDVLEPAAGMPGVVARRLMPTLPLKMKKANLRTCSLAFWIRPSM